MKRNNIITNNIITNSVIEEFPLLDKLYKKYEHTLHEDIFIPLGILQYTIQIRNNYKVTERIEYYK